jgi:hypothetical protein
VSLEQDRKDILKVHRDWWTANYGTQIPLMQTCFPRGNNYLMFNLNTHPYFGIDEKTKLWQHYLTQLKVPRMPQVMIMRLDINGDMAYIACEGMFPEKQIGPEGRGTVTRPLDPKKEIDWMRFRATEVYQRDDGEGHPVWKMWHFHASIMGPETEARPGFKDTPGERGLGGNPWNKPYSVLEGD